jgi:hypothetical protein
MTLKPLIILYRIINTLESINHNNYSDDYDELAYPFSKRIKLKHEPEKDHENVPVQYTAYIIVEIKIDLAQWCL